MVSSPTPRNLSGYPEFGSLSPETAFPTVVRAAAERSPGREAFSGLSCELE
jgi:hypothetical protein